MARKLKTGLGKGLDMLIPTVPEKEELQTPQMLKLSQVEPNRNQPRKQFDQEALKELAGSIKQYGVIQPIIVTKKEDYYEIIAGERRWRAAKLAGLKEIPVVVKEYSDKEIAEISLIENIQRENLNPIEEAQAYKTLIEEYELTQDELSERISKSRTQISNTMRLLKLHEDVQKLLTNGSLSAGHARALLGLEIMEEQLRVAEKIINENLSVRQTEDLVRQINHPPKTVQKPKKPGTNVFYKDLERRMTEKLGTKVKISRTDTGKGRIEISYFSEDELDRIYTMINQL